MGSVSTKSLIEEAKTSVKRSLKSTDDKSPIDLKKPKVDNVTDALQLVDINDHCLWHTFEFLDVDALVNIAEANPKRFQPVAISVFRQRQQRKNKKLFVNSSVLQFQSNDNCVCPADKNVEPFFRHFGHLISDASINFLGDKHNDIEMMLQKYSADSLIGLDLEFFDENDFQCIRKPFAKLEKLQINQSALCRKLSDLNTWFPNIQRLELVYVKLSQPELLHVHFPHLKHLEIYSEESELPFKAIRAMLLKNPQLKSLSLLCDYDRDILESLSQNMFALDELALWAPDDRFSQFQDHKIHFSSVKKFTLNARSSRGDFLVNIPFTFDALEELTFDGFNQFEGQIIDFVMDSMAVKKLKLVPSIDDWDDLMANDLQTIIDALPNLSELEFCADAYVIDDVTALLSNNTQLINVNLLFMDLAWWCEHFQQKIEIQWELTKRMIEKYNSKGLLSYIQISLKRKQTN